jgi:acyl transferase domain-containing protein/NADPH:quinone reductase-like Zn-dependent oxidoreductase/NAD(P)-dependent dehydrogenase (short-subunit alcohol dehydrogenase family)
MNNIKQTNRNKRQLKTKEEIAIVGIGLRYPSDIDTPEAFWDFITQKKDGFCDVPNSRWNQERFQDSSDQVEGTARPKQAAFISDEEMKSFDAPFFNLSPREAEGIDPQQRLLLRSSWEALENANIPPSRWAGKDIGVYVGGFTVDNLLMQNSSENFLKINQTSASSSTLVMLSNRVSYFFDFKGPSLTIDTACSSSLVALNYACRDIWNNNVEAALVGGVNAMLYPGFNVTMSKGGFLSPDSRSKAFDEQANGYARGEGVGVVVLKPLSKAQKDGDHIYATIKSTGVNQDGRSAGISSPNGASQSALIQKVINEGNISVDDIVMIEAHGTGTAVGDPTETNALNEVLPPRKDGQARYISSVKGNIGHQEAGAGVAGLIKTALSLHHDQIPPQANLKNINQELALSEGHLEVPRKVQSLAKQKAPKLACINSFGYGGTNAHAILSSYAATKHIEQNKKQTEHDQLLCISAQAPDAIRAQVENLLTLAEKNSISDIALTLGCGRDHMDHRLALPVSANSDLSTHLNHVLDSLKNGSLQTTVKPPKDSKGITFLYTGMGPQWWAMGHELYKNSYIFRTAVKEADEAFNKFSGWSIKEKMFDADETTSEMPSNIIAQPANFVLQHALTEFLISLGVKPDAIIGHSVGEVSAALAAGCLSLEQAAEVAYHRSRLQQTKAGQGRMLATGMDLETAKSIVSLYENDLSIGAINSPNSVALSGDEDTLRNVMSELDDQGIFNKLIFGEVAYHSYQMEDLEGELLKSLAHLKPKAPNLPLYSTAYGRKISGAEHTADYWWANVRQPVLFEQAMTKMANDGFSSFIEIGPNPVLAGAIAQVFAGIGQANAKTFSTLSRKSPEYIGLLELVGNLWTNNLLTDLSGIFDGNKIQLPSYPWQAELLWREAEYSRVYRTGDKVTPLLGHKTCDAIDTWENTLDSRTLASLRGHLIDNTPVFPGAGYIEAFLGAVNDVHPNQNFGLAHVDFAKMLTLPEDGSLQTRVSYTESALIFHARNIKQDEGWQEYATAKVVQQDRTPYNFHPEKLTDARSYQHQEVYDLLDQMGLNYKDDFKPISEATVSARNVQGILKLPEVCWNDERLITHPALMDGGLQLLALLFSEINTPLVPVKVGQLNILSPLDTGELIADASLDDGDIANIIFTDRNGKVFAEMNNIEMRAIPSQNTSTNDSLQYQFEWADVPLSEDENEANTLASRILAPISIADGLEKTLTGTVPTHIFVASSEVKPDPDEVFKFLDFIRTSPSHEQVVLLTFNAQAVCPSEDVNPAQAALWGIYRTTRHEFPKQKILALDLPAGFEDWNELPGILNRLPFHGEYCWREDKLLQKKLSHIDNQKTITRRLVENAETFSAALKNGERGGLSSLHFDGQWRKEPAPDEVEFQLEYAAINFKDILKVLNRLTDQTLKGTFFQKSLGMEASAIVSRAGKNTDYQVGERVVIGTRYGTFQSHITVKPEDAFILRWGDLPFTSAELATLPIGYTSAFYGLKKLAQLEEGETVLLHSASGAVGHAAIYVAKECGANIIATAGTEEKRQYLRDMGIEHVFNSRNLDFEHDVLEVTGSKGVDVILNFLPGDLLHANLRVLKSFGRIVELGKADIGANRGLPLGEFERNLSFYAVDIDHMLNERRDLFEKTTNELKTHLASGAYKAIPPIVTPAQDVEAAFRQMTEGNHIGKCLLDFTQPVKSLYFPKGNNPLVRTDATYVVTGGTQGFGLEIANWLVDEGARHLVLLSRSGKNGSAEIEALDRLLASKQGKLSVLACDVGNEDSLSAAFNQVEKEHPPIKGIFHAAAALYDAPIQDLTIDQVEDSFHAKALGAYNLHTLSIARNLQLDQFVLFSSISAMIGNSGQANYAAANVYLDALAEHRQQKGLVATSIAWGSLAETGMVVRDATVANFLERKGIIALSTKEALQNLTELTQNNVAHAGCFNIDFEKWKKTNKQFVGGNDPISSLLMDSSDGSQQDNLLNRLQSSTNDDQEDVVCDFLTDLLSSILNTKKELIALDKPVSMLGIDSLMSIEFQLAIESNIGKPDISIVPNIQKTLRDLAQTLLEKLSQVEDDAPSQENIHTLEIEELNIDDLSDEEVALLLEEMSEATTM